MTRIISGRVLQRQAGRMRVFLLVLLAVSLQGSTLRAQVAQQNARPTSDALHDLERDLTDIFNDPRFANATWGVSVQSMETGEYLFRLNDNKSLLPASNFKLFTSATALGLLTPEFQYSTQLVTTGRISDGVLKGDLIIRGAGDPTFGSEPMYPDSSPTWIYDAWADSLRKMGITRIEGSIIGDDTYFTDDIYPDGWAIEDQPYYYAMQTNGLPFCENQITVSVLPGLSKGSMARWELSPNTNFMTVDNRAKTKEDSIVARVKKRDTVIAVGSSSLDITRDYGTNMILLRGMMPISAPVEHQQLSVENPTMYAATVFRETLEEYDVTVTGKTRTARELSKPIPYLKAKVLNSYTSPPLSSIISVLNKQSDNLYAEQLFRTMGKEFGGEGSFKKGIEVMRNYLGSQGLDTARMAIHDGSGLSRMDLITAQQMSSLLRNMYERKRLFQPFYASMPVMGVDGTLGNRLKDTRAAGNVHAKTGFLTGVRSISGYLTTRDGELLAFSILGNNYTVPTSMANNLQDLAILRLVNFSRK